MANKFEGTIEKLQMLISVAGLKGKWEDDGQRKHTFRSSDGGILNWWQSSGTVQVQGQEKAKAKLGEAIEGGAIVSSREAAPALVAPQIPKQIFIVHGHDSEAWDQLELALHRLGLKPFILMNTSGGGKLLLRP
jgi:predicted nucleotide-binding protein